MVAALRELYQIGNGSQKHGIVVIIPLGAIGMGTYNSISSFRVSTF